MQQIYKNTKSYTRRHPHTHVIQRIARSAHQAGDVSMHRRMSPALSAIRVAFAPGVPVVNSHVRLLHLHFLHFITPTHSAMSIPHRHVNPSQTLLALTILHQQVSKCTVSPGQSESCCRVSSALNSAISRPLPRTCLNISNTNSQNHVIFFNPVCVFFKHSRHVWTLVSDSAHGDHGFY